MTRRGPVPCRRTQFGRPVVGQPALAELETLLAHIPGLTVVMRALARHVRAAARGDRGRQPVVFIENRLLYERSGRCRPGAPGAIGKAVIVRPGTDVTLVSWSRMVFDALAAADVLAGEDIDVEVIDLRTIVPLDRVTVLNSLRRTNGSSSPTKRSSTSASGRAGRARRRDGFWSLDAPVGRSARPTRRLRTTRRSSSVASGRRRHRPNRPRRRDVLTATRPHARPTTGRGHLRSRLRAAAVRVPRRSPSPRAAFG